MDAVHTPELEFLILVDNLNGTKVFPVESFLVDTAMARLVPVFDGGKTPQDRNWSQITSFRLVHPSSPLYRTVKELQEHPEILWV